MDEALTRTGEAHDGEPRAPSSSTPGPAPSGESGTDEKRTRARSRSRGSGGAGLVAGLALLPGAVGLAIAFFFFAEWPGSEGVGAVLFGGVVGTALWILLSLTALRSFGDVATADGAVYEELLTRLTALRARIPARSGAGADDYKEAREHLKRLEAALHPPSARAADGSPLRWLGGYGYINLWRHIHRAEEALLTLEPSPASLYIAAVADEGRLLGAAVDSRDVLLRALRDLLGEPEQRQSEMQAILARVDTKHGRALVSEVRFVLNSYRDELWQRLVRLRNQMFETLVYTGLVFDGLLALAIGVLDASYANAIAVALTYYLVGATVGLFAELYGASRRQRGAVHDYGLAIVRLLTIPVLSGIAAIGGVVLTRLGGTAGTGDTVAVTDIFSLQDYPFGVVVAAIFGLTPGLFLGRLRAQTDEYKKALVESGPATVRADGDSGA